MKVLAIDYDGVIVDSVLDSLFVSHNAYLKLFGNEKRKQFGGKPFTFQNWPTILQKYSKEIEYYRSLRPYIRDAIDYGLIQKLMENGKNIQSQIEFDKYRKTDRFGLEKFYDAFFKERKKLQEEDFEGWLSLEPPYEGVIKGIRKFVKEGIKVMVATSNRTEFIFQVFHPLYYDIPVKYEDILDFNFGEDKSKQIQYIHEKFKVNLKDIYFMDDQLAHLEQTRSLGISVFLAGWSYATIQQKGRAKIEGIPVINRSEDFYSILKEHMNRRLKYH